MLNFVQLQELEIAACNGNKSSQAELAKHFKSVGNQGLHNFWLAKSKGERSANFLAFKKKYEGKLWLSVERFGYYVASRAGIEYRGTAVSCYAEDVLRADEFESALGKLRKDEEILMFATSGSDYTVVRRLIETRGISYESKLNTTGKLIRQPKPN